jgi:PAS domain S-box-containing protein
MESPSTLLRLHLARLSDVVNSNGQSKEDAGEILRVIESDIRDLEADTFSDQHNDLFLLAPEPYLITDSVGAIQEANAAARAFLAADIQGLRHKPIVVFLADPELRHELRQRLRGMIPSEVMSFECVVRPYQGQATEVALSALKTISGDKKRILWLIRDISDRAKAEKEVRAANARLEESVAQRTAELQKTLEQLQQANRAKDEFLGLMSHELRTPLTVILGSSKLLRRTPEMVQQEDGQEVLNDIYNEAERLQRVIENLMVLAKLDGTNGSEAEPTLLQHTLPELASFVKTRYPSLNLKLSIEDGLPPVSAVPTYLELILHNLFGNAAKYAGNPDIELCAGLCANHVVVSIRDLGEGMTEEEASHIFEAFFRVQRSKGAQPGAGIGLTVCRRLVEAQGGDIWVKTSPGAGTTFRFSLPIWED